MFKRGLKLWSINFDCYSKDAQDFYEKGLYDYIELFAVPDSEDSIASWKKLKIPYIIHAPYFSLNFNLADNNNLETNLYIYRQVKYFADELNAKYIIFHGGVDGNVEEVIRQLQTINDTRAIIENKPYVAYQNLGGDHRCIGYTPEEVQTIINTTGCGFCFDFGHAICSANSQKLEVYNYCEQFNSLKPQMYHLTDVNDITSPYDEHPHLGKGELDMLKILNMIPDKSLVTIETEKKSSENLSDFAEDMYYLQKHFEKHKKM